MTNKYSDTYHIPYYDCDMEGRLKVPTLVKMMIRTSGNQSSHYGMTTEVVATYGLSWVITQHDVRINRLPRGNETIKITTQAEKYNKFFCYRKFWAHDENGEEIATMESTFALMDIKERKIKAVPDEIIAPFQSEKIKRIKRSEKIPDRGENADKKDIQITYWHIDENKHVNNAVYVEWMMDCLPLDFLVNHVPKRLLIKYNKEVRYEEQIIAVSKTEDNVTSCAIQSEDELFSEGFIEWN